LLGDFNKNRYSKDGSSCHCKTCAKETTRKWNQENKCVERRNKKIDHSAKFKTCTKCGIEKDIEMFSFVKIGYESRRNQCTSCRGRQSYEIAKKNGNIYPSESRRAASRKWAKKNTQYYRDYYKLDPKRHAKYQANYYSNNPGAEVRCSAIRSIKKRSSLKRAEIPEPLILLKIQNLKLTRLIKEKQK